VLAHAFFPQISQSLIPVIIKELGNLIKMRVAQSLDILSQLLQSELGMRFTVCMVEDIHQLSDDASEAVHKTCIFAFQVRNGLLFLPR